MNVPKHPTLDEAREAARLLAIYAAQSLVEACETSPGEAELFTPPVEDWDLQRIADFHDLKDEEMEAKRLALLALLDAFNGVGVWVGADRRKAGPMSGGGLPFNGS